MKQLSIYLLEPFLGGSHQQWARGWQAHSQHHIQIIGMPAKTWKWRMHGAAVHLAKEVRSLPEPDLFVASDMLNLATFKALSGSRKPCYLYFHENQINYPWSPQDEDTKINRDRHYGWINYTSALVADGVAFNSPYHREAFLAALPAFLGALPDFQGLDTIEEIRRKAIVLPIGMDFVEAKRTTRSANLAPLITWNHRWEYDKNPEDFFGLCRQLLAAGIAFRLAVLGEPKAAAPDIFAQAKAEFQEQIIHWGFAEDRSDYWQLLYETDLLPVTSRQDFFGISAVEAMYAGAQPLFPNRLAFPGHLSAGLRQKHLYNNPDECFQKAQRLLKETHQATPEAYRAAVAHYAWPQLIGAYDAWVG